MMAEADSESDELIEARFGAAMDQYRKGDLSAASKLFAAVAEARPDHAESFRMLGLIAHQARQPGQALGLLARAVQLAPGSAMALLNLGVVLRALDRPEEALAAYGKAIALAPGKASTWFNRGNLLCSLGRREQGLDDYARATALAPDQFDIHAARAAALRELGRLDDALAAYARALELRPDHVETLVARANALREAGREADAVAAYDGAIALMPSHAEAHHNRGSALLALGRPADALASHERAVALAPDNPSGHNNLGNALRALGRADEALAAYQRALALRPAFADALSNRGITLNDLGRFNESMADFEQALAIDPDYAEARWNQSLGDLALGRFERGWEDYEARWKLKANLAASKRAWQPLRRDATAIAGKRILVRWEQGLGDTIQFCRLVPLLAAQAEHVAFAPQPALARLMRSLPGDFDLVAPDDGGAYDIELPLLSLPYLLGLGLDTVPADIPYLAAEPERVEHWRRRIGDGGLRIGICWDGSATSPVLGRSFPVRLLAPIARLPGIRLISLQKGKGTDQLGDLPPGMKIETLGEDFDSGHGAFVDSAAVLSLCDLVISCDTAIAHLAGALGIRTWVALKHVADWRWLRDRSDSPWYPTMRLFRQRVAGDWEGVFEAMQRELAA
jgi:tetratricopeptide (TPR) repeat protein